MVNFWMNDISILLNKKYIFEIIPSTSFDINRKLNAIFRFSIYFSILSFAIYKQNSVFCFPFIVMIITIYIFKYSGGKSNDDSNKIEGSIKAETDPSVILQNKNENCIIPKVNNPFMNLNMFDISKNKKPGCLSYDNEGIKEKIDDIFDEGLYKDPTDIYSNNNSQNRYYTMPNTKPANDQGLFADWLYKTSTTCKEPGGGIQCAGNVSNRLNDNNWLIGHGSIESAPQLLSGTQRAFSTVRDEDYDKFGDKALYTTTGQTEAETKKYRDAYERESKGKQESVSKGGKLDDILSELKKYLEEK
jgi:hypothetical protein